MTRLRAGGCAFAVVLVLLGLVFAPASAVTQTANVVARGSGGTILPPDPLLAVGERIQLTITGFAPHAQLTVRLGTTQIGSLGADGRGQVVFSFTVPGGLGKGSYLVAAVGTPVITPVTPSYESGNATYDPQGVQAVVPTLGIFTFRLDPGGTSPPPTTSTPPSHSHHPSSSATSGSAAGAGGHLGQTGVNVIGLLIAAAIGLVGGLLILFPGQRRRHS